MAKNAQNFIGSWAHKSTHSERDRHKRKAKEAKEDSLWWSKNITGELRFQQISMAERRMD